MQKAKYIAILAVTLAMVFGLAVFGLAARDQETSRAERRHLAQAPELTAEAVFSGSYMTDLETYLLDQFPARDFWRSVQAALRFGVFRQRDVNGLYLAEDSSIRHISKLEYPLKEEQVQFAANRINQVVAQQLQGMNVYYSVIPDKNFFLAEENGYPAMDYDAMLGILHESVAAEYLDIFPLLTSEDYYRTDSHWRQECLPPVAQALADGMGLEASLEPADGYLENALGHFSGVYAGQAAVSTLPDTMLYLTSPAIDAAAMTGPELEGTHPVYTTERFHGMDGYDIFCAGAQAILTLESPLAKTDRELVIFRDSFGSSIAPLFLEGYARVTLIDLRYVASAFLPQLVEFTGQDVLFLYSTSLLNSGMLLQ